MNIYALFPLIATITYIPLLITTAVSRPWQRKHKLFIFFLIAAILWSLSDLLLRSGFLREHTVILGKLIIIMFTWMVVQFHCFTSSFFSPGQGRWLPFAYGTLAAVITLAVLGYLPEDIVVSGSKLYPVYGKWLVFMVVPLLTLAVRNSYIFWQRLKSLDNPVLYNQIVSLLISIFTLTIFAFTTLFPFGREFPVAHFGSIIIALVLSYATISHQLVDIRLVLRRSLAWISLGVFGVIGYLLLLSTLGMVLNSEFDFTTTFIATLSAILIAMLTYRLRGTLIATIVKAIQGPSYDYRHQLSEFASNIHNIFSLKEQGAELLALVTKATDCRRAHLLFPEAGTEDFTTQFVEPDGEANPSSSLKLERNNPIVEYLKKEHRRVTKEDLAVLPEFKSLWEEEKEQIKSNEIELFVPLISRNKLVGILALDKKQSGRYSLEDLNMLNEVTNQVAVSMEKEYLQEQLREREQMLAIINRSSSIITSSFDIQEIYDSFIEELKKIVDVSWAAIVMIEESDIRVLALSSKIGSRWQVGERIPIKGTATEWVAVHKKSIIEHDLTQESRFSTGTYHLEQGVRSIIYLPLIVKDEVIGSLIVASRQPNAYTQRHTKLLEQLASQIAMPIENSRLYAKAEWEARIDGLTNLLNRRSLDELITSEISRHTRYGGVFSFAILDLETLKVVNDNYGHLAGDRILKQTGEIMASAVRSADRAFRYGGDEFAVLLPQTTIEDAYQVAERIRKRAASELNVGDVRVTASVGLASWPADGIEPNAVIAAADAALYQAKRNGGNQSCRASETIAVSDNPVNGNWSAKNNEPVSNVFALAATVDARDHYTRSHSKKVNEYAIVLAEALNLDASEISMLGTSALLHDIGKIGISEKILNKPGKLTAAEWEAMKTHSSLGAAIIRHNDHVAPCTRCILYHHERYDGTGYPEGLKGEDIPLEARILTIADAFAAMTSERRYSNALSFEQALNEIRQGAGTQFDPRLAETFVSIMKERYTTTVEQNIK